MKTAKYDRLRRVDELDRLLARFALRPFRNENYQWGRHVARVRRIWTRLFLVLWELPLSLQTEFCSALASRTLPAFEQRHPGLTSMRDFLNPVWIRETIGDAPAGSNARWEQLGYELNVLRQALDARSPIGGDEPLDGAACALWDALEPGASPGKITDACIDAAMFAIKAERNEAWEVLDPEAAEYVRDIMAKVKSEGHVTMTDGPAKYRIPEADPAAQARWYAGWEAAITWLRSAHLETYDKVKDRSALARAVREARIGRSPSESAKDKSG